VLTGPIKESWPARPRRKPAPRSAYTPKVWNVARSVEEAALQEAGKSIAELAEEEAAEFEIQEPFDDIGPPQWTTFVYDAPSAAPASDNDEDQPSLMVR
jgi:large subunit ribosomal protein L9